MVNAVRIDIEVDHDVAKARTAGDRIRKPLVDAAGDIDRAFDKTSRGLANTLDKIEKDAWASGRGTNQAFDTALTGLRRGLELARQEGAVTGKGLRSSLGDSLGEIRKGAERLADSLKPVAKAAVPINQAFDKTARLVGVELDRMERDAWQSGRGMDAAFRSALRSIRDDFERVRDVGRRTGASLESDMGQALRDVKRDMDRLGQEAKETGREIDQALTGAAGEGGGFGDMLGESLSGGLDIGGLLEGTLGKAGIGAGVAAGGAAVGAMLADQIIQGFQSAWQRMDLGATFAASTGKTMATGLAMGQAVGDAYTDGFGDSMDDLAATANAALSRGLADTPAELGAITRTIETVTEVTGRSAEEIASAARTMVKSGLADSITEAFDLIVTGAQRGADAGGDMLETLAQSSGTLRQFGLDGETALGAFKQSLDAGAPSADTFVGALEELAGNASDAIPIFQQLGLGGIEFANALAGGGPKARDALGDLLDKIREIPDPAERARVMVGLFGEEATAMSDAITAVDLDSAAEGFQDIEGAAQDATAATQAFNDPMEILKRGGEDLFSQPWEGFFSSFIDMPDQGSISLAGLGDKITKMKAEAEDGAGANLQYAQSLQEIISATEEMANGVLSLSEAQIGYQEAMAGANKSLEENKKGLDLATEGGRENQSALNDLASSTFDVISAMEQQGATTDEVRGFVEGARAEFVAMAQRMGMSAAEANNLADKLGLIPGQYTAKVRVDASGVEGLLSRIRGSLSSIGGAIANINWGGMKWRQHGGITGGLDVWGAASGGQRHSATMINEAGPEIVELPNGSRVATAGAARAMADAGAFSSGGPTQVVISLAGSDGISRAILENLRVMIRNEHGGDVVAALGQGAA